MSNASASPVGLWESKEILAKSPAFVSYAREDSEFVLRLVADLKANGADVWLDKLQLRPGRQWDSEVEKALTACSELLVILSPTAVDSRNVMDEVAFALEESKTVIPVMYRDCRVPFRLRRLQYIDFKTDYQAALKVLLHALAEGELSASATAAGDSTPAAPQWELDASAVPVSEQGLEREKEEAMEEDTDVEPPALAASVDPSSGLSFGGGRPALTLGVLGGVGLLCIVGLAWYFLPRLSKSEPLAKLAARVLSAVVPPTYSEGETKVNSKDNLRYVWIPPGRFMMGCSPGDSECFDDEKPAHSVGISHGFWIGQTEVTQRAYKAVTGKPNPSHFQGDDLPVEQVTREEAESYCEAVGMRLPTEAEWEYAARGRGTHARIRGVPGLVAKGNLGDVAWYSDNSSFKTHPVGQKSPNSWGLYDVLGNVWEWCSDWYGAYPAEGQVDPAGPKSGAKKVMRGGSWGSFPSEARVSRRSGGEPTGRDDIIGFRCSGEMRGELVSDHR